MFHVRGNAVYPAILDVKATFGLVPGHEIWNALVNKRVPANCINVIKSIYQNPKGMVRLNGQMPILFNFFKGVKQGDSLSPLLSIVFMDEI